MTGLTILIATADVERARAALTLATAQAALGGRVRVYFHEGAVRLLAPGHADPALAANGLPDLDQLLALVLEADVELIVCQTGLAATGLAHDKLVPGVAAGGMVAVLATMGDDRLVAI